MSPTNKIKTQIEVVNVVEAYFKARSEMGGNAFDVEEPKEVVTMKTKS